MTDQHTPESSPPGQQSLGQRATSAAAWAVAARVVQQVVAIGRILILARLLAPDDFGLMGVAVAVLTVIQMFTTTGFSAAIVQRPGVINNAINTAFTIDLARAVLVSVALFASASLIAAAFEIPEASEVIRALAIVSLIGGLINPANVRLVRELRIKDTLWVQLGSVIAEAIVSITLAWILGSVWALVWGAVARAFAQVTVSYVINPYMPRLEFVKSEAAWMFRFGRWMALDFMMTQLAHQVDRVIIARVLGPAALGIYTVSNKLSLNVVREFSLVGSRVGFPALAKIQNRPSDFATRSLEMLELSLSVSVPAAVFLVVLADAAVPVLLGNQWMAAIGLTEILALAAIPMTIVATGSVALAAVGVPRAAAFANTVALITIIIAMPVLATESGITGAGQAILIAQSAAAALIVVLWIRRLSIPLMSVASPFVSPAILALAVGAPLLAIDSTEWTNVSKLVLGTLVSATAYGITSILLWRIANRGAFQMIATLLRRRTSAEAQ